MLRSKQAVVCVCGRKLRTRNAIDQPSRVLYFFSYTAVLRGADRPLLHLRQSKRMFVVVYPSISSHWAVLSQKSGRVTTARHGRSGRDRLESFILRRGRVLGKTLFFSHGFDVKARLPKTGLISWREGWNAPISKMSHCTRKEGLRSTDVCWRPL